MDIIFDSTGIYEIPGINEISGCQEITTFSLTSLPFSFDSIEIILCSGEQIEGVAFIIPQEYM